MSPLNPFYSGHVIPVCNTRGRNGSFMLMDIQCVKRSYKKDVLGRLIRGTTSDLFWMIYISELSCLLAIICVLCLCLDV